MKKLLLSLFVVLTAVFAKAEATTVEFDFDNTATQLFGIEGRSDSNGSAAGDILEDATAKLDGVSVIVSPSTTNTPNRLWTSSPVLRVYGGTITVSTTGHSISKIEFVANNKFNLSANVGTLEGKVWGTADKVSEVVFTVGGNTQLKSMTVTLDGEGEAPQPVEIAGKGEGTVESPYDVERALSLIANGENSTNNVYVTGTITKIDEINTQYGNATYYISNGQLEIMVYRGKGLEGNAFTAEDEIKVGDVVVLCGVLKDYNGTSEITNSSIYSLNGQGAPDTPDTPEYVPVGDGTKDNPYTVDDIIGMDIQESDGKEYWVKGIILGSAASATKLNDPDKAVDTNIALGMTAASTEFIPVALPKGEMRTVLGVATTPDLVGKEVAVLGTLEVYFKVAGVKNVTAAVIDGRETSAIEGIAADNAPVRYYNIQGVEVTNLQAGQLYIRVQGTKAVKVIK